jgi:hypothetical protein
MSDQGPVSLVFPGMYFLVWNGIVACPTIMAFSMLFRGKCDESKMILLCPLWLLGIWGILVPIYFGLAYCGVSGALALGFVDVILPYSCWAICFREENDDSNKTKEILILKKVVSQDDLMVEKDADESFRFNHPKSDLVIQRQRESNWLNKKSEAFTSESKNPNGNAEMENVSTSTTNSVQLCAICLEVYKVGQDIGWSRNPLCHHAFHKECILESLKARNSCPMCRNSYIVADEEESGHR